MPMEVRRNLLRRSLNPRRSQIRQRLTDVAISEVNELEERDPGTITEWPQGVHCMAGHGSREIDLPGTPSGAGSPVSLGVG